MLGEKVIAYKIDGNDRPEEIAEHTRRKILKNDFQIISFVGDANLGNMYLITLPKDKTFTADQIELTQQIFGDPVIYA